MNYVLDPETQCTCAGALRLTRAVTLVINKLVMTQTLPACTTPVRHVMHATVTRTGLAHIAVIDYEATTFCQPQVFPVQTLICVQYSQ
jgi:hypothetical protein